MPQPVHLLGSVTKKEVFKIESLFEKNDSQNAAVHPLVFPRHTQEMWKGQTIFHIMKC